MRKEEFVRLCDLLKAVYPRIEYLDNEDASRVFFNMMNRYDFNDVWKGVRNYLELEKYAPTIADLVRYVEDAERLRKESIRRASFSDIKRMTVQCPKCNDAGFVWVTYKNGTEVCRICDCPKAREDSPWAFMTEDQFEEENERLRKRGQSPPKGKPGHDSDWWEQECGEIESISPGRHAPGEAVQRGAS